MATIIDLGDDRFIAGDPDTELASENHWCDSCGGDGLDYDANDELTSCYACCGFGQNPCDDTDCTEHQARHA